MAAFLSSSLVAATSRRAAAAQRCACHGRPAGIPAGGAPSRRVVAVPTASAAEPSSPPKTEALVGSSDRAAALPWQTSVAGEEFPLLFMDFIVHMLGVMKGELTGVADLPFEESLSLQTGKKRVRLWGSHLGVAAAIARRVKPQGAGEGVGRGTPHGGRTRRSCSKWSDVNAVLQGYTPECGGFQVSLGAGF